MSGYHLRDIPKGVVGEASKVVEEALELLDAEEQGSRIMSLWEMGDVLLSLQTLRETKYQDTPWAEIEKAAEITRRVFEGGTRGPMVRRTEFCKAKDPKTLEWARLLLTSARTGLQWSHYGTGYAVAKLGDTAKFHVWHTAFVQDEELGGVHTHRWVLESAVMLGSITNAFYREVPEGKGWTRNGCGCGAGPVCETQSLELLQVWQGAIPQGEVYVSGKNTPHRVVAFDSSEVGTMTFVHKREREANEDSFFYLREGASRRANPYENPQPLTGEQRDIVLFTMERALQCK
jgi:phosphoribosyl-ATP pyrophosphohydrolase